MRYMSNFGVFPLTLNFLLHTRFVNRSLPHLLQFVCPLLSLQKQVILTNNNAFEYYLNVTLLSILKNDLLVDKPVDSVEISQSSHLYSSEFSDNFIFVIFFTEQFGSLCASIHSLGSVRLPK